MNNISAIAMAGVSALAVTGISGFTVIPFLRKVNFGIITEVTETKWHRIKSTLPTMGGIMPLFGMLCAVILTVVTDRITGGDIISQGSMVAREMYTKFWSGLMTAFAFAFVGLVDDYIRIVRSPVLGLTVRQKSVYVFFVALAYLTSLYMGMQGEPYIFIPFSGMIKTGFFHWIFGIILIYTAAGAANITDGIGGLCGGTFLVSALTLSIAAALRGNFGFSAAGAAACGAAVGFLLWNKNVLAGSTGSLLFAGVLLWLAYSIGCPIVLPLCGASYFIIGITEVIRVIYYKLSGRKRLLKAYPLQFHLKECGLSEKKITAIFIIINIIGGAAALIILHFGGFYR